jgi:hypothetical protein
MKKETKNFIQLLIWIIANEITKDQESKDDSGPKNDHEPKDNREKVFRRILNLLTKEYISGNSDGPDDESIKFGLEMIGLYYNRFADTTNDGDGALKLVSEKEFRLMNGKCAKEFGELTLIGHGGFGNVYRAKNALDNQEYAIKIVSLYGTKL